MTQRVRMRCTLPDGQTIETHMDIPLRDHREGPERMQVRTRVCLTEVARCYLRCMARTDLTEAQWCVLAPHLPANAKKGQAWSNHRRVINGILWRLKTGAPWRDIPTRYGPHQTCYDRFVRWGRNGTWARILQALQAEADARGDVDWDSAALDATHIKAHRSAAGARKQPAQAEKRGG